MAISDKKSEQNQDLSARLLMSSAAVMQALDISRSTLARLMRGQKSPDLLFPKPVPSIGITDHRWLRSDIEAWLAARLAR
jgi:predicted DNA-binding transcriptional regulator AlpA